MPTAQPQATDPISPALRQWEIRLGTLSRLGLGVFAISIIAIGVENWICATTSTDALGPQYKVLAVIPFLPAIPWLAYVVGTILVACGVGLLWKRTLRPSAITLGSLLFLCTVILEVPKNAAEPLSISLRTGVFEPAAMAALAWLVPDWATLPRWLVRFARYLLALSLIVFGVDHFLALRFIASLLPNWIPWHVFWVAFFGLVFIAGGLSIGLYVLLRWSAAGVGLMFAIWVFTLHAPRVLGLYGIPGAPRSPDEWSSLFIAVSLWGGLWAIMRNSRARA
jgi:uncharacterized membrane protein